MYLFTNVTTLTATNLFVVVDGVYIKSITPDKPEGEFSRIIDCKNRLMLPGLYNTHTHAAMTLFRGYGEDLPLQRWLEERIFPAEEKLSPSAVYAASMLAAAESIRAGVVSFTDMYMYCDETARAVAETGLKANICRPILSFDPSQPLRDNERFPEAVSLYNEWNNACSGRIKIDMSLHAEYTNTERSCRETAEYCKSIGANMHIHLSETKKEHVEGKARRGVTPARFMYNCGVFDSPTTAAHCVWLEDSDLTLLREKGVSVAHNPVSNLKLGSGVMPYRKFKDAGLNIALGTDGTASNNTLDLFKEMYIAALIHKGVNLAPDCVTATDVIESATVCGARAQGRSDCGRLEPGCRADLILLDLDSVNNIPSYNPAYTAVYSANGGDVRLTMVDGKILYENGEYTTLDIEKVKAEMRYTCAHYFD